MKRVILIGNSHAASIRLGLKAMAEQVAQRIEMHYFVASSPVFSRLGFDGSTFGALPGTALSNTERSFLVRMNGTDTVDLEDFDEILLVGMFWAGGNEIIPFLRSFAIDRLYETDHSQRLTEPAFAEMLKGCFRADRIESVWTNLRRPKLTLLLRPMPIALVRRLRANQILRESSWSSADIDYRRMRQVLEVQKNLAYRFYSDLGINLMHQPDVTLAPSGLTRNRYCRDQVDKVEGPGGKIDVGHMNEAFGAICLAVYLDQIAPKAADQ